MSTEFYRYEEQNIFFKKLKERSNDYYTNLWHGFLNYYDKETNKRIGYECIQAGYYLVID